MADTLTLATAAKALLQASAPPDVTIHDGEPLHAPPGRYVVVTDSAGIAAADRLARAGGSRDLRWLVTCKAVARTRDGVRSLSGWLRATLTDTHPAAGPSTGPLAEIGSSDLLTDGPDGDRRHSQTIIWAAHTDPRQED